MLFNCPINGAAAGRRATADHATLYIVGGVLAVWLAAVAWIVTM